MKCFIQSAFLGKAAYVAASVAPTPCTSIAGCKLGVMDTAFGRYAFQMLVLLACAIATWGDADPTPTREVVELVSVVYKPARVEAGPAGGPANAQTAASSLETSAAEEVASPKQVQGQPPVVVRSTKKPVTAPTEAKVSCRPPACRAADPGKQAVTKRTDTRQARKTEPPPSTEPPVPAVFVPVRRLGLYLQARLGVEQDGQLAPGSVKR
jgi:hypothetical protein